MSAELLRDGLLEGRVLALFGAGGEFAREIGVLCRRLGAEIVELTGETEAELAQSVERAPAFDALLCDGEELFGDAGGLPALRACVDRSWDAIHAVATVSFIAPGRGGKIMLLAPRAERDDFVGGARAAIENTARTLSIEWARHRIVTTAIAPAPTTSTLEVATLVAFIASAAGDYYSGCTFELGVCG